MGRTEEITAKALPFTGSGSLVKLRGPTSQVVAIPIPPAGLGRLTATQLAWEPADHRQQEIEFRAKITGIDGPATVGKIPIVRWFLQLSHDDYVWTQPAPPLRTSAGTPHVDPTIPGRGLVFRTNGREITLLAYYDGNIGGAGGVDTVELTFSVLPVLSQQLPRVPREQQITPAVANAFPIDANEFRLTDDVGLPLAIGAVGVIPTGVAGALLGPVDGALYGDWRPIPHEAAALIVDAICYAEYR